MNRRIQGSQEMVRGDMENNAAEPMVMTLAADEARRLGHNFIGTEQLLIAILAEGNNIAASLLNGRGVHLENVRDEVEKIVGKRDGVAAEEIPATPRVKRIVERAGQESKQLSHNFLGPEHLLLGLIAERDGVAVRVLEKYGINLDDLRKELLEWIRIRDSGT